MSGIGPLRMQIVRKDPKLSGPAGQTRDREEVGPPPGRIGREVARLAVVLGQQVAEERRRRRLTIRQVAALAGMGRATVDDIETGRVGYVETYVRLADALHLRTEFEMVDPRRREHTTSRAQDPVHAAMGEAEAAHLQALGFKVGLDEPFQHYQFAGRADLVAWSAERAALLHIENRTRFPDIQESFGSFNAKRSYLGPELFGRSGIPRWRSETHVIAALWSAEVLRVVRAHRASFGSVCPDPPDAIDSWWRGGPPATGRHSILVFFDPIEGRRRDRRRWAGLGELPSLRPRYRDYADAVMALQLRPEPDRG